MKPHDKLWVILLPDEVPGEDSCRADRAGEALSPLRVALQFVRDMVPPARTVVVSTPRDGMEDISVVLPAGNHLRLPHERGSGVSVFVALLWILERDPGAQVLVLGAEEAMRRRETLREALCEAVAPLARVPRRIVLVGVTPEPTERAHGWILPQRGSSPGESCDVAVFWEKPSSGNARRLLLSGALVRTTVLAAVGSSLLDIYGLCVPHITAALSDARPASWWRPNRRRNSIDNLDRTPRCDLWREVLQRAFDCLSLVTVGRTRQRHEGRGPSVALPAATAQRYAWSPGGWRPSLGDTVRRCPGAHAPGGSAA